MGVGPLELVVQPNLTKMLRPVTLKSLCFHLLKEFLVGDLLLEVGLSVEIFRLDVAES